MPDTQQKKQLPAAKPIIVLVVICAVISGLLAVANMITAPIIAQAEADRIKETLIVLLPDATSFTEIECEIKNVEAVYKDDGGSGYAIITTATGYHGPVTVITAVDNDGVIIAISVDASDETPGLGTQVALGSYTDSFKGLSGSAEDVDAIGGATYSSNAVKQAVDTALAAFEEIKEG